MLNQCLESLVQKVLSGVVINFEKTGPDPPPVGEGMHLHRTLFSQCNKMHVDYRIIIFSITYSRYLLDTQERKRNYVGNPVL